MAPGVIKDSDETVEFSPTHAKKAEQGVRIVRKEDFLIKAKNQAANEKLNSIFPQRPNFEAKQWIWVYHDKSTISGGGKHVLNAPVDGSTRKAFELVSKVVYR